MNFISEGKLCFTEKCQQLWISFWKVIWNKRFCTPIQQLWISFLKANYVSLKPNGYVELLHSIIPFHWTIKTLKHIKWVLISRHIRRKVIIDILMGSEQRLQAQVLSKLSSQSISMQTLSSHEFSTTLLEIRCSKILAFYSVVNSLSSWQYWQSITAG